MWFPARTEAMTDPTPTRARERHRPLPLQVLLDPALPEAGTPSPHPGAHVGWIMDVLGHSAGANRP